jgi:hypothetical protein
MARRCKETGFLGFPNFEKPKQNTLNKEII